MSVALSRAFLGLYPPPDALDALTARLGALRDLPAAAGLRWVARDQLHLTVRFCGRVPDAEALVEGVGAAVADTATIDGLVLAGAGAFPTPRRASVCWVGVTEVVAGALASLGRMARAVEAACVSAGLRPDDRDLRPHVSVARARVRDVRGLVEALGTEPVGPPWAARELRLVANDTRAGGAVHTEIARIPLGGAA